MARRRFRKAGFNTKLIMDVGLAGIGVRLIPLVVNKFFPLDPTLYAVAGAGGTYLVGSMMKKPDLANAGIALGLVELVAPMVENLIGGIGGTSNASITTGAGAGAGSGTGGAQDPLYLGPPITGYEGRGAGGVKDYLRLSRLNDYIANPSVRQGINQYNTSY